MSQPDLDPKTLVWYPLFSFVLFLILYILFDIPVWIFFLLLFLSFVYLAVLILIELKRK